MLYGFSYVNSGKNELHFKRVTKLQGRAGTYLVRGGDYESEMIICFAARSRDIQKKQGNYS
jgi:hypothetical protein